MDAIDALITGLRKKQGNETMRVFGARLGISDAQLVRLYSQDRTFSRDILGAIKILYPDLTPEVDAYMAEFGKRLLESSAAA